MAAESRSRSSRAKPAGPRKPWGRETSELPKYVMNDLYQVYYFLDKETRKRVGLVMEVPVFIKDPAVALENPLLGVQEIGVRLEVGMSGGPTSSRVAVVDFNADTQTLADPVVWDGEVGWFRAPLPPPAAGQPGEEPPVEWLVDLPGGIRDPQRKERAYRQFIEDAIKDPYFHQVNAWAVVQRVLEFYEEPWALGRPVPWGFDGNRLIVVPHAGYGENAFYDQHSKSLQFYYFGDLENPGYTCLSHDIIAHETGHAVLDGIRPLYNQLASVQTAAFHEFMGDQTAILLALFNEDIRHFISQTTQGELAEADILAEIARQFGEEVEGRPYLRTAYNCLTMEDVQDSLSPHNISQVLTGAMFDILIGIADTNMKKARPVDASAESEDTEEGALAQPGSDPEAGAATPGQRMTPARALWLSAERLRQVALQALDLCPPCDIQFLDYARAVIRNDILTNPVDEDGYRQIMLEVFHRRKICTCGYLAGQPVRVDCVEAEAGLEQPGTASGTAAVEELPEDCPIREAMDLQRLELVYHDIGRVSRSRTAAYYFLSDNRKALRIPAHQDVRVADLYDNNKLGAGAERLPREVVLEYTWQEAVTLADDPAKGLAFGEWNGKTFNLDCGGTLVFDERGNLLSWFRKPGTEHISQAEEGAILARKAAWEDDPVQANQQKVKPPTLHERGALADLGVGRQRKAALLAYLAALIRNGLVGALQAESRFSDGLRPVVAIEQGGVVHFELTPHLRKSDFDAKEGGWTVSF